MPEPSEAYCSLAGKVAVVFGCATGIGAASARRLAARGARVVLADLDAERVAHVAEHIVANGHAAIPTRCDVSSEDDIAAALQLAVDRYGRLDIVHNNAAATHLVSQDKDVQRTTVELWDQTMQVNVRGQMLACKHAVGHLMAAGGGSIVNTSSLSGIAGELTSTAYGASKAAINQLTRAVATQYGRKGIRCNAVLPGLIQFEGERPPGRGLDPQLRATLARHQLVPYPGRGDDVANAVVFLASDEARFITGQLLVVDGGMSIHQPFYADMLDVLDGGKPSAP